ncbi:hypothetical protein QZH41_013752, partial [Actinostola sp. cb2023]
CQDFRVREDGALANKLQEEEFQKHYCRNKSERKTVRGDVRVAKQTYLEEVKTAQLLPEDELVDMEETDKWLARDLQEKLHSEEQKEIDRQARIALRDAKVAKDIEDREKEKYEREWHRRREEETLGRERQEREHREAKRQELDRQTELEMRDARIAKDLQERERHRYERERQRRREKEMVRADGQEMDRQRELELRDARIARDLQEREKQKFDREWHRRREQEILEEQERRHFQMRTEVDPVERERDEDDEQKDTEKDIERQRIKKDEEYAKMLQDQERRIVEVEKIAADDRKLAMEEQDRELARHLQRKEYHRMQQERKERQMRRANSVPSDRRSVNLEDPRRLPSYDEAVHRHQMPDLLPGHDFPENHHDDGPNRYSCVSTNSSGGVGSHPSSLERETNVELVERESCPTVKDHGRTHRDSEHLSSRGPEHPSALLEDDRNLSGDHGESRKDIQPSTEEGFTKDDREDRRPPREDQHIRDDSDERYLSRQHEHMRSDRDERQQHREGRRSPSDHGHRRDGRHPPREHGHSQDRREDVIEGRQSPRDHGYTREDRHPPRDHGHSQDRREDVIEGRQSPRDHGYTREDRHPPRDHDHSQDQREDRQPSPTEYERLIPESENQKHIYSDDHSNSEQPVWQTREPAHPSPPSSLERVKENSDNNRQSARSSYAPSSGHSSYDRRSQTSGHAGSSPSRADVWERFDDDEEFYNASGRNSRQMVRSRTVASSQPTHHGSERPLSYNVVEGIDPTFRREPKKSEDPKDQNAEERAKAVPLIKPQRRRSAEKKKDRSADRERAEKENCKQQ